MVFQVEGEVPAMAFFVPIIHVAVGVGMAYYALCLFLNRSYINIEHGFLTVKHQPLPWWNSNTNISIGELEQLYIKEVRGNKGKRYYRLKAKLKNGKDKNILRMPDMKTESLRQIEEAIETHLGIEDAPAHGEYQIERHALNQPTKQQRQGQPIIAAPGSRQLQDLLVGHFVDYHSQTFEVIYLTRYIWKDGNRHQLLQLFSAEDLEVLVFLHQNAGIYTPWIEQKLNPTEAARVAFDPESPNAELFYDDDNYQLKEQAVGDMYRKDGDAGLATQQWIYRNDFDSLQLRILNNEGMISVYKGAKELSGEFENFLIP